MLVETYKVELTRVDMDVVRRALGLWRDALNTEFGYGPVANAAQIQAVLLDHCNDLASRLQAAVLREEGQAEVLPWEESVDIPF